MALALWLFWLSFCGIAYTYLGYPLFAWLMTRWWRRPIASGDVTPSVTVLIAAYNEQSYLAQKLENTLALDYSPEDLEILVVTDGSDDDSNAVARGYADRGVRLLYQAERGGKSAALRRAFPHAQGDVIVFTDANAILPRDVLRRMASCFADPTVGGVTGRKVIRSEERLAQSQGEGLYWRYESFVKACDSALGSVMGATGEIWAARREAYRPPEAHVILDDLVASLGMVADGWRVVFVPEAVAYEDASPSLAAEWRRRVRNAAGGWQAIGLLRELLRRRRWLAAFQYLSHRLLRWTLVPLLFICLLGSNLALLPLVGYRVILAGQVLFYLLALVGWLFGKAGITHPLLTGPFYVVMLNAAALVGGARYLMGRQPVTWQKVR